MAPPTIDGEARFRLDQSERTAEPGGERIRPRTFDGVAGDGPVVEVGRDLLAECDAALGDGSVRKVQCKPLGIGVVLRPDLHERSVPQLVEASSVLVDDVKAAVLANAGVLDITVSGWSRPSPLTGAIEIRLTAGTA